MILIADSDCIEGKMPECFVPVQSQAPIQVRGRAQAPTPAFNPKPAFAFEIYDISQRKADWTVTIFLL